MTEQFLKRSSYQTVEIARKGQLGNIIWEVIATERKDTDCETPSDHEMSDAAVATILCDNKGYGEFIST